MAGFVRETTGGIALSVRLTPRAASDAVDGVKYDSAGREMLTARVRAVPEKGAANAALEQLIARWMDVPRCTITVTGGATQRLKTISVKGDGAELARRVALLATRISKLA